MPTTGLMEFEGLILSVRSKSRKISSLAVGKTSSSCVLTSNPYVNLIVLEVTASGELHYYALLL